MNSKKHFLSFGFLVVVLLIFLAHFPSPSTGQAAGTYQAYLPLIFSPPEPPAWVGPYGGHISAAAAHGDTVYAGTWGSGVYKSTDGGITWVKKDVGLISPYITALAIDPQNPQIAYAGTNPQAVGLDRNPGIYKTTDGGETWFLIGNGINPEESVIVYDIAIDPHDGENILISTRGKSNNGEPPWRGVVYRTTDQGYTWEPKLTEVGGKAQRDWVYFIAISYRNPRLVYAATHEHGIFRSDTFGNKNWEEVNTGISKDNGKFTTRGVVVNPLSEEPNVIVYTGTWVGGDIFRSNTGGDSWFWTGGAPAESHILRMSIDPVGSKIYAAAFGGGVLRTTDGGNHWSIAGLHGLKVVSIAVNSTNPAVLYGVTDGNGLFKSADYGESWGRQDNGLRATRINDFVVAADNAQRLFAAVEIQGVQQTSNGGAYWGDLGEDLNDPVVLGLASPPAHPETLFALTGSSGLYRCDLRHGGECWKFVRIDFPLTDQPQNQLQRPFASPPLIEDLPTTPAAPEGRPPLYIMRFSPSNPEVAYLGTGVGVYRSLDRGNTWSARGWSGKAITALAIHPTDENQVYVADYTHIWYTSDGGVNWDDTGFSGADVYALALDDAGTLYAGTSDGIYRYQAGGWTHLALGGLPVTEVVLHPDETGWIYAGTTDGLRISHDSGITWVAGPAALNGLVVSAITLDPSDLHRIYVSTTTQGVLRMQDY